MFDLATFAARIADIGPIVLALMGAALTMVPNLPHRLPEKYLLMIAFIVVGVLVSTASIYTTYVSAAQVRASDAKLMNALGKIADAESEVKTFTTGGENFPVIQPLLTDGQPFSPMYLILINKKYSPIYDVIGIIQSEVEGLPIIKYINIPIVRPHQGFPLSVSIGIGEYQSTLEARNWSTTEFISIFKSDDRLHYKIRIYVRGKYGEPIYSDSN